MSLIEIYVNNEIAELKEKDEITSGDISLNNRAKMVHRSTMNKTKGVCELVVNTKTKTFVHFLFKK